MYSDITTKVSKQCMIKLQNIRNAITCLKVQAPQYEQLEYHGNGTFALVLKAKNKSTNTFVALKIQECDENNIVGLNSTIQEYKLLKEIPPSDYIIKIMNQFYLVREEFDDRGISFQSKAYHVFEMEICNMNLRQWIDQLKQKNSEMPSEMKETITVHLLDSLSSLHSKGVIHRDIKPSNFLLKMEENGKITCKICDLGSASTKSLSRSRSFVSAKGTKEYLAPECENGECRPESDLFALGLIILEIDNVINFTFQSVSSKDIVMLSEGEIFKNHNIQRDTILYKIASICLKPGVRDRKSASELLQMLRTHSKELQKIPIFSLLSDSTNASVALSLSQGRNNSFNNYQLNFGFSQEEICAIIKHLSSLKQFSGEFIPTNFNSRNLFLIARNVVHNQQTMIKVQKIEQESRLEVYVMNICQTENAIKLYDHWPFEYKDKKYSIFEVEKGICTLDVFFSRIVEESEISTEVKERFAKSIIQSIAHLHEKNIIHKDINLSKFLVCENEKGEKIVKLGDFSSCEFLNDKDKQGKINPKDCKFPAPEQFQNNFANKKTDSFQTGITLLLLDNFTALSDDFDKKLSDLQKPFNIPLEAQGQQDKVDRKSSIYCYVRRILKFDPNEREELTRLGEDIAENQKTQRGQQIQISLNDSNLFGSGQNQDPGLLLLALLLKGLVSEKLENAFQVSGERSCDNEDQLICNQINQKCSTLQVLVLNLIRKKFSRLQIQAILNSIQPCNSLSKFIFILYRFDLQIDEMLKLSNILKNNLGSLKVVHLDLKYCSINDDGAEKVVESLKLCQNAINFTIHLTGCQIGDRTAYQIANLIEGNKNLNVVQFVLSNTKIGEEGISNICSAISQSQSIISINLHFSQIFSNNSTLQMNQMIKSKRDSFQILRITVSKSKIDDESAARIISEIGSSKLLERITLDISDNEQIGKKVDISNSKAFSGLPELTHLDLRLNGTSLKDDSIIEISNDIGKCQKLVQLIFDIGNCPQITPKGVEKALQKFLQGQTLQKLNLVLSKTNFLEKEYVSIFDQITQSTSLIKIKLGIQDSSIMEGAIYEIAAKASLCNRLKSIKFQTKQNQFLKFEEITKKTFSIVIGKRCGFEVERE